MTNFSDMKTKWTIILLSLLLFLNISCSREKPQARDKFVIGFSQCTTGDAWRQKMIEEMKREISFYREYNIDLIIKNAENSNRKQIQDIRELVDEGIDLLIVSPNEARPLTPIVEEVYGKGISVIVIDRKIHSEEYTAYIGADNFSIGKEAGQFAISLLKGKGKVLEIQGLKGSTPAMERSEGFREIIKQYNQVNIVKSLQGQWLQEHTKKLTDSLFQYYRNFDLIFAHNDRMARSAYLSCQEYGIDPYIIGIDGLNEPQKGIPMVVKGQIDGTFIYPTGGDKAIQLAIKILTGKSYYKNNILHTTRIDSTNARTYQFQAMELKEQQERIDRQSKLIGELDYLVQRRNTFLVLSLLVILLLIVTAGLIYRFLRQKNKINKTLAAKNATIENQNKKITHQRDHLQRMVKVAEEANEMKLRFFTNISHEFRTILSMIVLPVNELINTTQDPSVKEKLQTIHKSTNRLLRLSEEVMNFRKLDKNRYQVKYHRGNLSDFLREIAESFKPRANKKNITLEYDLPEKVEADFDPGVMEKVIFNLISNAIKYTAEQGKVSLVLFEKNQEVHLLIKDTGYGISEEELPYIFDRFFRGKNDPINEDPGTGIGLAFSKELIQLHNGDIQVNSKKNEGTVFQVCIPKYYEKPLENRFEQDKEQEALSDLPEENTDSRHTILIVEDNPELRCVEFNILKKYYHVIVAENGQQGLEQAKYHLPDLIISDILMPGMDGMEMCSLLKKNPLTQHVPIILLTALDSSDNTIKGFDTGADDYITKPFNENILISRIKNLIASREKLKQQLGNAWMDFEEIKSQSQEDQEFIRQCLEIIYENAANEEFRIQGLAEKMNLSQSSLYRKIKKITGMKTVDFMKKAKLKLAASLLLKKNKSISEVAWESGFTDAKYFSKCFTEEFGELPSKYRERLIHEGES
jgi:signal transduction histidine kinase/DNA-binding response OmpR family regulator/DNA-binding LacI/PurR family transcriptional regulator